jgi:hypothetical protein
MARGAKYRPATAAGGLSKAGNKTKRAVSRRPTSRAKGKRAERGKRNGARIACLLPFNSTDTCTKPTPYILSLWSWPSLRHLQWPTIEARTRHCTTMRSVVSSSNECKESKGVAKPIARRPFIPHFGCRPVYCHSEGKLQLERRISRSKHQGDASPWLSMIYSCLDLYYTACASNSPASAMGTSSRAAQSPKASPGARLWRHWSNASASRSASTSARTSAR